MEKVKFQVLGYRNFKKKDTGKPMTILTAVSPCTDADESRGNFGMKAVDFFMPDDRVNTLEPECIGMEFVPEYEISIYGRPVLSGFTFKPWK